MRLHSIAPFERLDPWSRPFTRGDLAREVIRLRWRIDRHDEGVAASYLAELEEELASEIESIRHGGAGRSSLTLRSEALVTAESRREGAIRGIARIDFAVRPLPRFSWHQRVEIDSDGKNDPDFTGREWQDEVTAHFHFAYFALAFENVRLTAGRRDVDWGVGLEGGMLLGGAKPPFDLVGGELNYRNITGEAFVAPLDETVSVGAEGEMIRAKRYIAAHRVTFHLGTRLHVGLSESIIYGGENRSFDWSYANPLLLYYGEQWNRGQNDNPFWSVDAYLRASGQVDLFAEFLVDDFQYDFESEPNQIGYLAGGRIKEIPGREKFFLDWEYLRVNNWVYGHDQPWNRYTFGSANLGHPLGPDADRTLLRIAYRATRQWEAGGWFRYERHGEGRIDDPRRSAVPFGNTFLTGDVELRRGGGATIAWRPGARQRFRLAAEVTEGEWTVTGTARIRWTAF